MEYFEYIQQFFDGELSDTQKKEFENKILVDDKFAEEVAFYIKSKNIAAKQIVAQQKPKSLFWIRVGLPAIAASIALVLGYNYLFSEEKTLESTPILMKDSVDIFKDSITIKKDSLLKKKQKYK